jgi:hypothetical protein
MWRKTPLGLCAIVMVVGLVASASVHAAAKNNLGSSIKIPQGGSVQMLNNGHFTIKGVARKGIGVCECSCAGGSGTCVLSVTTQDVSCTKGKTGTCSGDCTIISTMTGQ